MEEFLGKRYVLVSSENFEDYLKFLGVSFIARKVVLALKPVQSLTLNEDGSYTFSFSTALVTASFTFVPGEEFEETMPDGVKVKSVATIEGNKMLHIQKEDNGRVSRHLREFHSDRMIETTTSEGLNKIVTRNYVLVQ